MKNGIPKVSALAADFRHGLLNLFTIFLTPFFLASCEGQSLVSNSSVSNQSAQTTLELRLKKTDQIKIRLESIRDALGPVESVLTDISNALNTKVSIDDHSGDLLHHVIAKLRELINDASKGLVEFRKDGSWIMSRNLSLPLGRPDYHCQSSQIEVIGEQTQDHDQLTVRLVDCSSVAPLNIIELSAYPDRIEAGFYPGALNQLIAPEIKLGRCSLRLEKDEVSLNCEPLELKSESSTTLVDHLTYSQDHRGTNVLINVTLRDKSGKLIANLKFQAQPDLPSQIAVRTIE